MLTDTEARALLHQAAQTVDVPPGDHLAPPRGRRPLLVPLAVAAAVILIAAGLFAWHANTAAPADRPSNGVVVPTVYGYPVGRALGILRSLGYRPHVREDFTCADPGRAIRTEPSVGTALPPGSRITVVAASNGDFLCNPTPRDLAWKLVDLSLGSSVPTLFARDVQLSVNDDPPVRLTRVAAADPARWPACGADEPTCPGTALDVLRTALATTQTAYGDVQSPRLTVLRPEHDADVTFRIGFFSQGFDAFPQWTVSVGLSGSGRARSVHLDYRSGPPAVAQLNPPPVSGADPGGLARRVIDFATGQSRSLPIDTPVRLYLGHRYQETISARQAEDARSWSVCRQGYADGACPFSALQTLATYAANGYPLHVSPPPEGGDVGFCLELRGGAPTDTGGDHVIAIGPAHRGCVGTFEVDVYSNGTGQIVAVDLLLGNPCQAPDQQQCVVTPQ